MRVTHPHAIQSAAPSTHRSDGAAVRGWTQEPQSSSSPVSAGLWHASNIIGLAVLCREQHRGGEEGCGAMQPSPRTLLQGPDPRCLQDGWTRTAGGASTRGETLASLQPPPRLGGKEPSAQGLSLELPRGTGFPRPGAGAALGQHANTHVLPFCLHVLGWPRMCPRLLSQPHCIAALVWEASFRAGWDGG